MSDPWSRRFQWLIALAPFVHSFGVTTLGASLVSSNEISLTDQERSCLSWTLKGKIAWEISVIIGRSKPTVEYHLQKAMRKMDASNKAHAAATAMRLGLL